LPNSKTFCFKQTLELLHRLIVCGFCRVKLA